MVKNDFLKISIKGKGKLLPFLIVLILLVLLALFVLFIENKAIHTQVDAKQTIPGEKQEIFTKINLIDSLEGVNNLLSMETELQHLIGTEEDWASLQFTAGERIWIFDKIAGFFQRLNNLEEAKAYSDKAYILLDSTERIDLKASILNNKSTIESDMGNFEEAIRLLFDGMRLYGTDTTAADFIDFYNNLGSAYSGIEKYDLAIYYFEKLINLAEQLGMEEEYGYYYGNLGHTYMVLGQLEKSAALFEEARRYFAQYDQLEEELLLNTVLASNYTKIGKLKEAEQLLVGGLEQMEERQLWMPYVETTISLFDYYLALGNTQEALIVINRGMEKIHYSETNRLRLKIYDRLINYYQEINNYRVAFDYLTKRNQVADSISTAISGDLMRELTVRYETERKNERITQLTSLNEKEKSLNKVFVLSILLLVFIMLLIGWLLRRISIQNRALADANYTKDKLFSVIAHDLRSPMSALQGVSSLMRYYLEEKDEEKLLQLSQKTDFTLNNINDLLDNLLNWAVANHEEIKLEPQKQSIKELLEKTVSLYKSNIEIRNIDFVKNLEDADLWMDTNMISSVLRNIFSNAIKHSPRNSQIILKGRVESDYYIISLQDSGNGIDQDILDNLFNKKDQLLRRVGKDSFGLGLRLTLYFVQRNHGKLLIHNGEPGALVEVHLPLKNSFE